MGVTQLWSVVQPCARPIKIETLNKKRLAVDSSLWIYQFLKAVRDKEGNALRNSHVVGFYRRICKLLYLGIKPVFVFDGGAPALKRQTIAGRKSRREGRREDATRTAGKLLALQMQRRAEEEAEKERQQRSRAAGAANAAREEEEVPDNPVYVDEIQMTQQERQQNRKFRKKDQYHLPELDVSLAEMGQPNDPRVMSLEELEQYARQFDSGEDINVYDFSKIDFDSPFFISLPATDRYNILNAARLRSRLRMGLSKDQLDKMFPDRMAFSRFQIDRVKERNELTQRLMHINGMTDDAMFGVDGTGRVAGEKGREYVLVKNTGVEGGWALGVIGESDRGERNKPIDVDELSKPLKTEEKEQSDEDEEHAFEDVPIEGLNRLPKVLASATNGATSAAPSRDVLKQRNALYKSRRQQVTTKPAGQAQQEPDDSTSLFISEPGNQNATPLHNDETSDVDDDDELQRAIAMSLENGGRLSSPEDDDFDEVFQVDGAEPITKHSKSTASAGNPVASYSVPIADDSDDEGGMVFENALTDTKPPPEKGSTPSKPAPSSENNKFGGPLPFEKLDLGSSILGKKKMKKIEQDNAGGFEKNFGESKQKKQATTLPPWFSDDLISGLKAQDTLQKEDRAKDREADEEENFIFPEQPKLRKQESSAFIDVDALDGKDNVITVESDDEKSPEPNDDDYVEVDTEVRMGDVADLARVDPPETQQSAENIPNGQEHDVVPMPDSITTKLVEPSVVGHVEEDEEPLDWEESDREDRTDSVQTQSQTQPEEPAEGPPQVSPSRSPSLEFEEVKMDEPETITEDSNDIPDKVSEHEEEQENGEEIVPMAGSAEEGGSKAIHDSDEDQYFSEEEDEELMMQLAKETEEHARFASTLNQKTTQQNIEEYERELKALRSQQKKDRRDADEVTQVMITECQQLLKLFGLPYITAPMEAEAQCAELVSLGLVDGIVTDDSDVFLFGGTRIYKNMFNQAKYVECYLTSDLEREFDLTREKLIRIAHLLGSDYTEGLPGIGPVTALEIISDFPGGLDEFKDWWSAVQMGAKPTEADLASAFRKKFRRNITRLFLPPTFPDRRVDHAYLHPEVDSDPSPFQWGVPDLDALRSYLMATIGWSPERTDEVLVPVIRDMNRRENEGTQSNITGYIAGGTGGTGAFAPRRRDVGKSKRMETALEKLADRAREKRKATVTGEQDKTVQADEAIIAVPGSATEGNTVGKQPQPRRQMGNGASKRKNGPSKDAAAHLDSDDETPDERPTKKNKTKSKKKAK